MMRLGGAVIADMMVDNQRGMAQAVPRRVILRQTGQRHTVRAARQRGEKVVCFMVPAGALKACPQGVIKNRWQRGGDGSAGTAISHRSWRPRSMPPAVPSAAATAPERRLAAAGKCHRPDRAARNAIPIQQPRLWCRSDEHLPDRHG